MTEKHLVLFATTRPSRAGEVQEPSVNVEMRKLLEESWADALGIDVTQFRERANGTETSSTNQTTSTTIVGAQTMEKGVVNDYAAHQQSDTQADKMTDDIHNDSGTGGIIDVPF